MLSIAPESFGPLGDATLSGITWENEGRDLGINFAPSGQAANRFVFTWAKHVSISLKQGEKHALQPLSWGGSAEKLATGRVRVMIEFPPLGEISLECEEILSSGK